MENKALLQAIKEMIQEEIKPLKEEVSAIKSDMATKADIAQLDSKIAAMDSKIDAMDNKINALATHQEENVIGLLSLMNCNIDSLTIASKDSTDKATKRLDQIDKKQTTQGESINLLALRQFQQETEIALLKKAE